MIVPGNLFFLGSIEKKKQIVLMLANYIMKPGDQGSFVIGLQLSAGRE